MMRKSFLKNTTTERYVVIDKETGEVMDEYTNNLSYLANTKEEFYLMYSSMVLILKTSKDVNMKLFAALLERYSHGAEFSMSKGLKTIIAKECECSPRSLDNSFSFLVKEHVVIRLDCNLYRIEPRHIFKGASNQRNKELKAVVEMYCEDC